jgi:hypothetical protein
MGLFGALKYNFTYMGPMYGIKNIVNTMANFNTKEFCGLTMGQSKRLVVD